jgi:hypothetical protein
MGGRIKISRQNGNKTGFLEQQHFLKPTPVLITDRVFRLREWWSLQHCSEGPELKG